MQPTRRHAEQEMHILAKLGLALEAEIIFEAHAFLREDEQTHTHADRGRGKGGNAEFGATREDFAPDVEHEKIETVDEQIGAGKKRVDVRIIDAAIEAWDADFRIDGARHLLEHLGLGPAEARDGSADLTVEIGRFEAVEIGDRESTNAKARQGQQMEAADTDRKSTRLNSSHIP